MLTLSFCLTEIYQKHQQINAYCGVYIHKMKSKFHYMREIQRIESFIYQNLCKVTKWKTIVRILQPKNYQFRVF